MFKFKFADIGEGIHEGKVFEIFVKDNQSVKEGDTLLSVETDKMTADIPSPVSGKIAKVLISKGQTIHVGEDMFEIDDGSSNSKQAEAKVETKTETKKTEPIKVVEKQVEKAEKVEEAGASVVGEVKVSNDLLPNELFGPDKPLKRVRTQQARSSPLARSLAKQNGVNLNSVSGTGHDNRITREDVINAQSKPTTSSTISSSIKKPEPTKVQLMSQKEFFSDANEKRAPISSVRSAIAKAMRNSWSTVAYTNLVNEVKADNLIKLRELVKSEMEMQGIKVTYLAYIVKAAAKALEENPQLNGIYDEAKNEMLYKRDINIGIAVDAPQGLVVPVIKNANKLSIVQIAQEVTRLASIARANKLTMAELGGGTFSITNYGSVGSLFGVPVIKTPELGILGIGAFTQRLAYDENKNVIESNYFNLTGAFDHRWVDGAEIGRFTSRIKQLLENPVVLLH